MQGNKIPKWERAEIKTAEADMHWCQTMELSNTKYEMSVFNVSKEINVWK